jgi:ribonuclease HI
VQELPDGSLQLQAERPSRSIRRTRNLRVATNFNQYIQSLAAWEQHLLQGVQFFQQPYEIIHQASLSLLRDDMKLLLVSDGSQRGAIITYGWVFGSGDGKIYAEHSGTGAGEATSHRAEAWGMLSGALFVAHLYRYTTGRDHIMQDFPVTFLCDNQGLVKRITQRLTYTTCYPNATLEADWDIIEQIYHTILKIPSKDHRISWVKGHQDTSNRALPIEAQFNVRADALAGSHFPAGGHQTAMLPAARCQLVLENMSVTSHYTRAIRQAYTLPSFNQYLIQRHKWTQLQCTSLDWEVFSRAVNNIPSSEVQLLKLVHDKLPTNGELAKSNPHQSPICHYCNSRETFFHLLTCSNDTSVTFRQHLLDAVQEYMLQHDSPERFQACFLYCFDTSLTDSTATLPNTFSAEEKKAITTQLDLGRQAVFQGFWPKSWTSLYVTHYRRYDTGLYKLPCRPLDDRVARAIEILGEPLENP